MKWSLVMAAALAACCVASLAAVPKRNVEPLGPQPPPHSCCVMPTTPCF